MSLVQNNIRWGARAGTAADLAAANEVPLLQEPIFETDTGRMKLGDGTTHYNDLPYFAGPLGDLSNVDAPSPSDGQVLTWDAASAKYKPKTPSSGSSVWTTKKKTADESRASSATPAADSALQFAAASGKRYHVRGKVFYSIANATMDFLGGPAFSGTTSSVYNHRRFMPAGTSGSTDSETASTISSLVNSALLSSATGVGFYEFDVIVNTTSAGTFSFDWSQNTSDPGNCTVLAGSYLEYAEF